LRVQFLVQGKNEQCRLGNADFPGTYPRHQQQCQRQNDCTHSAALSHFRLKRSPLEKGEAPKVRGSSLQDQKAKGRGVASLMYVRHCGDAFVTVTPPPGCAATVVATPPPP